MSKDLICTSTQIELKQFATQKLGFVGAFLYDSCLCVLYRQYISIYLDSMQLLMLFFSLLIGALVVTFNVVALGGRVSFFQTFSILSYCIFPIFACVLAQKVLTFFQLKSRAITVLFITMAVIWSIIGK